MDRNKYFNFLIIILIFFVVKLSILLLGVDKLIYTEECFRALIAKQLLDGPILPFFDLQCDSYSGGSLVVGLLMVPFFKILGQNLISLKMVALLFSLLSLISLYFFCDKFFNRKVAVVTSLLFILSPPLFTRYSLITMGFHTESILFSILLVFVFFEIIFNNKKDNSYFILLGLISGFGLWFTYIFSITLFTCLLFWFLLDRRFFLRKPFLVFLISFTISFSPWIYYNLSHGFSGFSIGRRSLFPYFSIDHLIFSLAKLKNLLLNDIRNSFLFDEFISLGGNYLSNFYYLIFIVSFLVLFWLNRRFIYQLIRRFILLKRFEISGAFMFKETFLLIHVVIFFLIYSLSNFQVNSILEGFFGYRYLTPLYPIIFIIIALFLNKAQEKGTKGKVFFSHLLLVIIISIGLVSNLKFISFNKICIKFFDIDYAHAYTSLGRKIGRRYGGDIDKCISLVNQVEGGYRSYLYQGLESAIGLKCKNDIDKCISLINQLEEKHRLHLYRILGFTISRRFGNDIDKCIGLINQVEGGYRSYLYQGLGFAIGLKCKKDFDNCISLANQVEEKYKPYVYKGISHRFKLNGFKGDIGKWVSPINQIEEEYRPYFYRSLGINFIRRITRGKYSADKYINLINQIEEEYRPYFYRALGMHFIRCRYSTDRCTNLINRVEERYRPDVYEGFGEGVIETGHWRWVKGMVAYQISLIHWMEEVYKIPFYKGIGEGFAWQYDLGTDRYKVIIEREIEDKYKPYVYEGLNDT